MIKAMLMVTFSLVGFFANAQNVSGLRSRDTLNCSEVKYKYYCECKILPNCGGQCWVPAYIKFELATGQENVVKYFDQQPGPGTEDNCNNKLSKLPICR